MRLLLVGNPAREHVGAHLMDGAEELGLEAEIADTRAASAGPLWKQRLFWHALGHRPAALGAFNRWLLQKAQAFRPDVLLTTGIAPVTEETLRTLKGRGIVLVNYQTDDPWNPANSARHFWPALPRYDWIFSPRHAAIADLKAIGCRHVEYLAFAYNPRLHFLEAPPSEEIATKYRCDVAIIGGGDRDRYPLAEAIAEAGWQLRLYGGYWDRKKTLRPFAQGFVLGHELRWASYSASVHLCMGRKANREGHAMRSYELLAMGAVLLVENTEDHRNLFGLEGEAVLYYESTEEMVREAQLLLRYGEAKRRAMAAQAHARVTGGANTYTDRLRAMIGSAC